MSSDVYMQYDVEEDGHYIVVGDEELGPLSDEELNEVHNCVYAQLYH